LEGAPAAVTRISRTATATKVAIALIEQAASAPLGTEPVRQARRPDATRRRQIAGSGTDQAVNTGNEVGPSSPPAAPIRQYRATRSPQPASRTTGLRAIGPVMDRLCRGTLRAGLPIRFPRPPAAEAAAMPVPPRVVAERRARDGSHRVWSYEYSDYLKRAYIVGHMNLVSSKHQIITDNRGAPPNIVCRRSVPMGLLASAAEARPAVSRSSRRIADGPCKESSR
jgi:hypothetical protein